MKRIIFIVFLFFAFPAINNAMESANYNEVGFFDIHVCHWPDRPLFFLALFSTYKYDQVEKLEIHDPNGVDMGALNLTKIRVWQAEKGEKHAFINQLKIPENAPNGWYTMTITMKDGSQYSAKDYVIIQEMPLATGFVPAANSENVATNVVLKWNPVPGAQFYQVFIRDFWNDEKIIFTSDIINKPELQVPPNLLEPNGWYGWRVHSRDTNEHNLLGDFNHGSLSKEIRFTTSEDK